MVWSILEFKRNPSKILTLHKPILSTDKEMDNGEKNRTSSCSGVFLWIIEKVVQKFKIQYGTKRKLPL